MVRIIHLQVVVQTACKVLNRTKVAPLEKAARQDSEPQFDLREPCPMFGGKVKDMFMGRITQEGASLDTALQGLGGKREITPRRDQAAEFQAPVRIEIIAPPVVALHVGQLLDHGGQMRGEIRTGPRWAKIPHHLPGRDDKGSQQHPRAMPNVFLFALCRLAGLHQLRRILALQNLHAGLFVGADHQAVGLVEAQGLEIQGTDRLGLGLKGRIMAVEPVDTPMWFEIGGIQNPPDG